MASAVGYCVRKRPTKPPELLRFAAPLGPHSAHLNAVGSETRGTQSTWDSSIVHYCRQSLNLYWGDLLLKQDMSSPLHGLSFWGPTMSLPVRAERHLAEN